MTTWKVQSKVILSQNSLCPYSFLAKQCISFPCKTVNIHGPKLFCSGTTSVLGLKYKMKYLKLRGTAPLTKNSMFCALSQNYQHLVMKNNMSYRKLSKELKNGIKIKVG